MKFKATLEDSHTFLGVLQVCRSIQKDCIIRLHSTRVRFFTTIEAFDGVQVWIGCRTSHLFHDFRCVSPYNEQSITCEILDMAQLFHIIKQADTRERRTNPSLSYNNNNNNNSNNDYQQQRQRESASRTVIRLARSGEQPIWKITMQGQAGMPDLSYDVPVRILSDNELAQMNAPPLEEHRIQIVLPHLQELTLFIEKLKLTSCETVTFDAQVMQETNTATEITNNELNDDNNQLSTSNTGHEDNIDEQLRENEEEEEKEERKEVNSHNMEEKESGIANGEVEEVIPIYRNKTNNSKSNKTNNNDNERGYYKRDRANEEVNEHPMHTKLIIRAEHAFAEFVLEYDNVELLEHPKVSMSFDNANENKKESSKINANEHESEEEQLQECERRSAKIQEAKMAVESGEKLMYRAEVSVDVRKFARFFSAVKEVAPTRVSMYLVHRRALVLSVYGSNSTTMVAYIPVKM